MTKVAFRQADLKRALKATQDAGVSIGRIEIEPTGKIVILTDSLSALLDEKEPANEWDEVLAAS